MKKETEIDKLVKESLYGPPKQIMLYNDDVNSFENVMECLMTFCGHNLYQAEQCATLVHHVGKCSVKVGYIDSLTEIVKQLKDNKLNVEIENGYNYN